MKDYENDFFSKKMKDFENEFDKFVDVKRKKTFD